MMVMHKVLALLLFGVILSSVRSGSSCDNFLRVLMVAADAEPGSILGSGSAFHEYEELEIPRLQFARGSRTSCPTQASFGEGTRSSRTTLGAVYCLFDSTTHSHRIDDLFCYLVSGRSMLRTQPRRMAGVGVLLLKRSTLASGPRSCSARTPMRSLG